ncbi:cell growth regulator with RING finger domain protein 1-like [Palaemon carinicauda]|uniref:cell growth regulator with RING finger domain protein 1-like n=1 Tax=Palaemon carinicauda TaxID=392227 RepID=UPI0035B596CB
MVAVLTAALMTAAEISTLFSALGVIVCLICMVVFISRVNGEEFFGTSVVHVAQPPVAQVSVQKVAVPFSLELHRPEEIKFSDVQLKIKSDVTYTFRSYWGVMQDHLHSLMGSPWSSFYLDLIEDCQLSAEIINDAERCDDSSKTFKYKTLSHDESASLNLGTSPRKKYPLVVCMVREDSPPLEEVDPSNVGALITIIHIKDTDCQVPTCILHQYLKQYSGQLTRLQALYTQSNQSSSNEETTQDVNDDTKGNSDVDKVDSEDSDDNDIPIEEACVVCQTNRITRALLPCRHVCVCRSCCSRLETCPMCRTRFEAYFLVSPEDEEPDDQEESIEQDTRSTWQRICDVINNTLFLED